MELLARAAGLAVERPPPDQYAAGCILAQFEATGDVRMHSPAMPADAAARKDLFSRTVGTLIKVLSLWSRGPIKGKPTARVTHSMRPPQRRIAASAGTARCCGEKEDNMRTACHIATVTGLSALAACASMDLRMSGTLNPEDARSAGRLAEAVQRQCVHYRFLEGAIQQKTSGDMRFSAPPEIRRLYTSRSGWTKAEFFGDRVFGVAYYHEASDRIVCGDSAWAMNPSNASVVFEDVQSAGAVRSTPVARPAAPAAPPAPAAAPDAGSVRPLAVQWAAQGGLLSGFVMLRTASRSATLSIAVPDGRGTCSGVSELGADGKGTWAVSCTNGATAAGTMRGLGTGKGSVGSGTDAAGGEVRFTMGPAAQ